MIPPSLPFILDKPETSAILVITLVSFIVSLISIAMTKKFVYTPEFIKQREIVMKYKKELQEAKKNNDQKKLKKLNKKKEQMQKLEAKMSLSSLKTFPMSFPFIIVFMWLAQNYNALGNFIVLPIYLPLIAEFNPSLGAWTINWFWWYFITSFCFSTILRKVLKLQ